jgi:hypothetical protein
MMSLLADAQTMMLAVPDLKYLIQIVDVILQVLILFIPL